MNRRAVARCFVAATLLAITALAHTREASAQQSPTISSITLTPVAATVGDHLTLTIGVDHNTAFTVQGPGFGDNFGPLELLEVLEPQKDFNGNETRTTLRYTLTSFQLGRNTLPPLRIHWRGPGAQGDLQTPQQDVVINSVLVPGDTQLRPLKPQLDISSDAPSPIWPAGYVALFAVLTAFGYFLMRRAIDQRPPEHIAPPPRPLLPHERARADLDALAAQRVAPRDYYAKIAFILRRYLTERFDFPAYAMTRRELQRHMSRSDVDRWPARLAANVLEQCDAVQFAGLLPARERMDADLDAAYEIVRLTAPPEEPEVAAVAVESPPSV